MLVIENPVIREGAVDEEGGGTPFRIRMGATMSCNSLKSSSNVRCNDRRGNSSALANVCIRSSRAIGAKCFRR